MKRLDPEIIDFYNNEVVRMIMEKYGFGFMDALGFFVNSKTHVMLEYEDYGMTDFSPQAILEIWEVEKITGYPQYSIYIRGE